MTRSVETVYAEKLAHEAAAKRVWEALALELSNLIPVSCHTFANSVNWIRAKDPQFHDIWQLPKRLEKWIHYMKETGVGTVLEFCEGDLDETGFLNCRDARKKLRELAHAWKDFFRIQLSTQMHQGEIEKITMVIYVIGYRKKRRAKAVTSSTSRRK